MVNNVYIPVTVVVFWASQAWILGDHDGKKIGQIDRAATI